MAEEGVRQDALRARLREEIISELMASGGVAYDRASLELLYYIPEGFRTAYIRVFHEALANTDGGTGQRGRQGSDTAALGRAPGKAAGKTKQKRGVFSIADESVLEIKDKADKRLRQIGRDLLRELDEIHSVRVGKNTDTSGAGVYERQQVDADIKANNNGVLRATCEGCGKFTQIDWAFCARCGHRLK